MSSSANSSAPKKVSKKADAPAAAPAIVAAAVEDAKKVVKKAAVAPGVAVSVAAPAAVVAAAAVDSAADVSSAPSLADEIKALQDQLTTIRDSATTALATLKRVEKMSAKEIKNARKNKRSASSEGAGGEPRKPSNFEIPLPITDELSLFLGGGKGNQMTRAQVKSAIHKYINDKNLRVKHDITPDAPLRKLLGVEPDVKLTTFTIQTYLSRHFPKAAAATTAA